MLYANPHARSVVEKTAQLWLHIPINFETVKAEELKHMIFEWRHSATAATQSLTRANRYPKLNVLKNGKKHTAALLAGYLKTTK